MIPRQEDICWIVPDFYVTVDLCLILNVSENLSVSHSSIIIMKINTGTVQTSILIAVSKKNRTTYRKVEEVPILSILEPGKIIDFPLNKALFLWNTWDYSLKICHNHFVKFPIYVLDLVDAKLFIDIDNSSQQNCMQKSYFSKVRTKLRNAIFFACFKNVYP